MNFKFAATALVLGCSFLAIPACAVDASQQDTDEETSASQDELNAAATRLVGAYHQTGGAARPPTFEGLVLLRDGSYFADVDTGIRCVRAPCPSNVRLEGTFSATAKTLRLNPKPGQQASAFHGKYNYTLSNGGELGLTRAGASWNNWSNTFSKKNSYCAEPKDCGGQGLIHPMCVGQWTCGEQNACGYKCGGIAVDNSVWPANATKLVANNAGGGFTPPPAPGSVCGLGAANYSLDVASRKLTWKECSFADWNTPMKWETGSRVLTVAELASLKLVLKNVKISDNDICGADKPFMTMTVSTPSGDKKYTDDFYSCRADQGPFVDNIDSVFAALRDLKN